MRGDIQDLKLHLKQAHKKNKREIDDLVELGMIEVEPKKPRISYRKWFTLTIVKKELIRFLSSF